MKTFKNFKTALVAADTAKKQLDDATNWLKKAKRIEITFRPHERNDPHAQCRIVKIVVDGKNVPVTDEFTLKYHSSWSKEEENLLLFTYKLRTKEQETRAVIEMSAPYSSAEVISSGLMRSNKFQVYSSWFSADGQLNYDKRWR